MTIRVLTNIGELTTNDPTLGDQSPMGRISNAALIVDDERVLWVGTANSSLVGDEVLDLEGAAVIPGFVDSHTHLVFAGDRSDEFEARMKGQRYDGGGINRTRQATNEASDQELRRLTEKRLRELRSGGVTTVEIKTGYSLDVDGEHRLARIANEFSEEVTLLGAHVVPSEFADRRGDYIALVRTMITQNRDYARWFDVFCDRGAFSVSEARELLLEARDAGYQLRLHGNQLGETGGIALAVEMDCASVDHCTFASDEDLALLAASNTVATLLPGAEFSTRSPYPNARRFLDRGVNVALATDCNPGTSYTTSMSLMIALAVREMAMTPDEALWAATLGGARALRRSDIGHLSVGARADYVVLDAPRAAHLAYRPGSPVIARTHRGLRL